MKNFSSLIGWVIFICALAIPAFLFYNWITAKTNVNDSNNIQLKSSIDSSKIFKQNDNMKSLEYNQISSTTFPDLNQQFSTSKSSIPVPNSAKSQNDIQNDIAEKKENTNIKVKVSNPSIVISTSSILISTMSYYQPISGRDPILTPMDYARMREEEERIKRAEEERKREALIKKLSDNPIKKLSLQGIVGNNAIINGEMVNLGETFKGFKILKIGTNYVIGIYKDGKRYKLVLK